MKDYIKIMLGYPVVNVELADVNLEQIIEDSCQTFSRYVYEDGSYTDYITFTTSAGVADYYTSAIWNPATKSYLDNVQDVYDFSVAVGLDGINIMFTPTHILLHDQFVTQGAYPGGSMGALGVNDGLTLTNYTIAQMYIKEIDRLFGKQFRAKFIPGKEVIKIIPTPQDRYTGVLIVHRKLEDMYLYNHPIVKRLCTGKSKMLWGRFVMGKYGGTLPDGLTLNGDGIYDDGKQEYDKALEDCTKETEPPMFMVG